MVRSEITTIPIFDEVLNFFASDPIGPLLNLDIVADDPCHRICPLIEKQLGLFDSQIVEDIKEDEQFLWFYGETSLTELDRKARIWALKQLLSKKIPQARLKALLNCSNTQRPMPYCHPAIEDLTLTPEYLVSLNQFNVVASVLIRNHTGFTVVPAVEAINSQYWLIQSLVRERLEDFSFVRLDPFLVQHEKDYPCIEYRMWWYGMSLDWKRIDQLKSEEHGRWSPEKLSNRSFYTDYAWTPRDAEIHFRCEELPIEEDLITRGSRYFHAIYMPKRKTFTHIDGSVRIYNSREWKQRHAVHVRKAGKIGKRVKVFRVDTEVTRDAMANICPNFFVWNHDVARYFGAMIPNDC